MKLLGVSGSLREASFNSALLHCSAELLPEGVEVEVFRLHDLPLFNQDVEDAGDPEPVQRWKQAITDADGVLFACPEYNGGVTGVLKNAVDWASRGAPAPLQGKLCCIVGASPGATGTVRAQDALRLNLRRAGADVAPLGEVLVFHAPTKIIDGQLADQKTVAVLGRHLASYVAALRQRS